MASLRLLCAQHGGRELHLLPRPEAPRCRTSSQLAPRRALPRTRARSGEGEQTAEPDQARSSSSSSAAPPAATATPPAAKSSSGRGFGKAPTPPPPKKETKPNPFAAAAAAGSPSKSSARVARRAAPQQPLLGTEGTSEQEKQTETAIVSTLGLIFVIILLEGLFLAAAGFLPEEWDTFALESVYPAFSPTVGVFILCAAGYGLYKFLGSGKPE